MVTDCQRCGACCFSDSDAYVPVTPDDLERLAEQRELARTEGEQHYMEMRDEHCTALRVIAGRFACSIYAHRPAVCRELQQGSAACLEEFRLKKAAARRMLQGLVPGK